MTAKAFGLCIGLNKVDPIHYSGWDGYLQACERDAKDMHLILASRGFSVTCLLTEQATRNAVLGNLLALAQKAVAGDLVVITYSGHGGQLPDVDGDESDGADETWVLYDGQVSDDRLALAYSDFAPGVRVLVTSDSCHSGTVVRAFGVNERYSGDAKMMPSEIGQRVYLANKDFYDQAAADAGPRKVPEASVLLISGCLDYEVSYDGLHNGAFTSALKQVWNGGRWRGSHGSFRLRIKALLNGRQTPNYVWYGARDQAFEAQTPFTL